MVFSRALTEKVPLSLNEGGRQSTRIISNDDGVFNFIYLIKMKDYIVIKQGGLCELSEVAEILSIVNVNVFGLFIYICLYENMGLVEELPRTINSKKQKISHRQGTKVSSERRLFSKMNFVTCRSILVVILHVIEYSI